MVTEKRISRMKREIFIDNVQNMGGSGEVSRVTATAEKKKKKNNVKNMFVLSILQKFLHFLKG